MIHHVPTVRHMSRFSWRTGAVAVLCTVAVLLTTAPAQADVGVLKTASVRDFGAAGDGVTNDSPAFDRTIAAVNGSGGGIVRIPAGTYLAGATIHMRSDVTLYFDRGATLLGAPSGYDPAEPNPNDAYQDFGHSHFHNAMITGDNLHHIGFAGPGVIDGGGNFITGNPKQGQADKLISLTRCSDLFVGSGLTLRRGGHFAMLINGCDGVQSDRLTIDTASDRDGWNVISTTNVRITNISIAANDDALAFKSDWALGATLPNGNVSVTGARLSARCCNALMFGSETCGDFTGYRFTDIAITSAGKSGLGMVSMDGAHISDVVYENVTMSGTASPITVKVGTRKRCGNDPGVGWIRDVHYRNVTGTSAGTFSPTVWGEPGGHEVSGITFENVHLTLPGGQSAPDPNAVPQNNGDYNPNGIGTRPAYGFYLHNVDGVSFDRAAFDLSADDPRPALIVNGGRDVKLHGVTAERGANSPFDVGLQSVEGYEVDPVGALRLSTPHSTGVAAGDLFTATATPATQTGLAGRRVLYQVRTAVAAGNPGWVTLAATGLPKGATARFTPEAVRPGGQATMTVTIPTGTRNATYPVTVVATGATATQYATAALTVTGGQDLTVSGLTVADPANAADWSVRSDLRSGDVLYGDRTWTLTGIPAELLGARWIRTANDSRTSTASPLARFTLSAPATVLVAVDTRLGRRPWLDASWTDTGSQLSPFEGGTTYRRYQVYAKDFPAGPVSLGPADAGTGAANMYTVLVV
jgi:hypothetical protein